MNIYERIKSSCTEQGITIAALEASVGISNGAISKWKAQTPKADNLYIVAKHLGKTVEYFLTGKESAVVLGKDLADEEARIFGYYKDLDPEDKILVHAKIIELYREQGNRKPEELGSAAN